MGLDMYLNGRRFLWTYDENSEEYKTERNISAQFPELKDEKIKYIETEFMYWRKANAIHNWFVEHVQDGEDNCRPYSVSWDDLQDLYNDIVEALDAPEKASEILPTTSGFFFGSTEYGEWYFEDLKQTRDVIGDLLARREELEKHWSLEYRASW